MEREAGQGERDIKKMQAEIESLRKEADATGWSAEKEQVSEEALRRAKNDAMCCAQVGVYPLFHTQIFGQLLDYIGAGCGAFTAFPA